MRVNYRMKRPAKKDYFPRHSYGWCATCLLGKVALLEHFQVAPAAFAPARCA